MAQRHYSDATAEMMSWSAWNATAGRRGAATRPAWTEAGAIAREDCGEAGHLRIDLTVEDAEDLAAQLRALIAAAKMRSQGPPTNPPAAIALAGFQVGAGPRPALRFSDAQSAGRPESPVIRTAIPA